MNIQNEENNILKLAKDMMTETSSNSDIKENLLKEGYYLLISERVKISLPLERRKGGIEKYVLVLLNDEKADFKILHLNVVKASLKYQEISVQDAQKMLSQEHPVLKIIEQLNSVKNENIPWNLKEEANSIKEIQYQCKRNNIVPPNETYATLYKSLEIIKNKPKPWFISKEDMFLKPEDLWYEGQFTPPPENIIPVSQSLEAIEKMRNSNKTNKNTPK